MELGSLRQLRAVDAKAAGGDRNTSSMHTYRKTQYYRRRALRCLHSCRKCKVEKVSQKSRSCCQLTQIPTTGEIQNSLLRPRATDINASFRRECLNEQRFESLHEAKERIETWRREYNESRPHRALQDRMPDKFARAYAQDHLCEPLISAGGSPWRWYGEREPITIMRK